MTLTVGKSRVTLTRMNGCCYIGDLEGAKTSDTLLIAELARRLKTRRPVFFVVSEDNPRKESLMKTYIRRLPARKAFTFLEVL